MNKNNKIKLVKRNAYGYKYFYNLRKMILLHLRLSYEKEIAFAISQAPFIIDTEPELILTIFDNQNMINPSLF